MSRLKATERTAHRRLKDRGSHETAEIYRILDEGMVCHVGFATPRGPFVIPMGYGRDGDRLILHGSVGSRLMRALAAGAEACVTVTLLDGLVLARSAFDHSMNYRSVVAFGRAAPIEPEEEKRAALDRVVEHLIPGRTRDARAPSKEELAATTVLAFPLDEASAKVRSGPPGAEAPADMELPIWAGVIPLRLVVEQPEPSPDLKGGIDAPDYVTAYGRPTG